MKITVIIIVNKNANSQTKSSRQSTCTIQSVQYSISCIHDIKIKCKNSI